MNAKIESKVHTAKFSLLYPDFLRSLPNDEEHTLSLSFKNHEAMVSLGLPSFTPGNAHISGSALELPLALFSGRANDPPRDRRR
jgi:hypothetical protein